jgi:hypothetical protein
MSFIVKAAKSVVRGVVNAVKGVVKAVGKVVSAVVNFVVQPFMSLLGGPGTPDGAGEAERQQGVLISKPAGGDTSIPVIYGLRQVGGQMIYFETGSDNNKYLWVVYALSEGPIEGIYDLSLDDEDLSTPTLISTLNSGALASVDKAKSRYTGKAVFQFWNGQLTPESQVTQMSTYVSNHLLKEAPSWKNTNIMNGMACLLARYELKKITTQAEADNNPFGGSIPAVKVTVMGRKVSSLLAGAGTENTEWGDFPGGYLERYSTNPAECLLDYLRNPYYGKGLKNSEIDWDSFKTAAAKYNQLVTYVNGVQGPILTSNYVLDTGNTIMNNVKMMLQGCRSYMPYVKGKYKLKVEDAGNPTDILSGSATVVMVFDKDNIVGEITYTGVDRTAKYTAVEVTYVSPSDKWSNQTVTFPTTEAERQANVTADGGRENKGTFTFPSLTNHAMAYDMARLIYNKSRYQQTISFKAPLQAMELEPGDNIHLNSTMLDFYNDADPGASIPWRVVSLRLNNDYSYNVDCVRNPDFIYPHARAGEKDVVLPPYIPRGSFIYYPGATTDIGLRPPQNAYRLPGSVAGNVSTGGFPNPNPSNPADSVYGGGVGTPDFVAATPVPAELIAPPELNDFINIDNVIYTVEGNLVSATVSFTQPQHPLYAGVDFWFKRNISTDTTYRTDSNTEIVGPGVVVQHTIQGLIKGRIPYVLVSRVRYTNGDSSNFAVRTPLNVNGIVSTENPPDYEETAGSGWDLPEGDVSSRAVMFNKIVAVPSLSGSNARRLAFTINQDINTTGFNGNVAGMNIYYRLSGTTYFSKTAVAFDGTYFPSRDYSFTPTLSLGVGVPSPDDASDNFDFIFRFYFADLAESTKQWRYMGADVANTSGFDPFAAVMKFNEDSSAYSFATLDQAPPGSVADPIDMTIGVTKVSNALSNTVSRIYFDITPPALADRPNWYGIRLRYRPIPTSSTVVPFENTDYFPVPQPAAGVWQLYKAITYDTDYQYILTPVVNKDGVQSEAKYSWLGRGKIHNRSTATDYPSLGNWLSTLNFRRIETTSIAALAETPISGGEPVPRVTTWSRTQGSNSTPNSPNTTYFNLAWNTNHIEGCLGVYLYRRANNTSFQAQWGSVYAQYYGLGRWERVSLAANGSATVRAPISFEEYNPYYGLPGQTVPLVKNTFPWVGTKKVLANLAGSNTSPPTGWQYYLVAYTAAGEVTIGTMLPVILSGLTTSPNSPSIVDRSTLNGTPSGFQRRLSEYRTAPSNTDLLDITFAAYTGGRT